MEKLTAALIVKNEERFIRQCLESLKWVDEIIILDGFSTDRTVEICREYTDKVFQRPFSGSFNEERQFLISKADNDWVLMVDADMLVPPEAAGEIRAVLSPDAAAGYAAFNFRALTIYLGRPIRHCGWFAPEYTRLFNRKKGSYDTRLKYIDNFVPAGRTGVMKEHLIHYGYETVSEHVARIDRYTTLNTEDLRIKGVGITPVNAFWYFFAKPAAVFFYKYFYRRGFLDGAQGFIVCSISAFVYLISYFKLWEAGRAAGVPAGPEI